MKWIFRNTTEPPPNSPSLQRSGGGHPSLQRRGSGGGHHTSLRKKAARRDRAFSLIELLFVIAIISLLAALLFPVFEKARENGRAAVCLSNMRQIGMSLNMYLQDYDETFPMNRFPDKLHPEGKCALTETNGYPLSTSEDTSVNWRRVMQPYIKSKAATVCPSNPYSMTRTFQAYPWGDQTNIHYPEKDWLPLSYAYNGNFFHEAVPSCLYKEAKDRPRSLPEISAPTNLILLTESRAVYPDIGTWIAGFSTDQNGRGPYQSHNGQITFLFSDLHVKRMKFAATCKAKMWTDMFPDGSTVCQNLSQLPEEYK